MAHENLPFSGATSSSVYAFSLAVKCGCCVEINSSEELWKLPRNKTKMKSGQAPHQVEMECPRFTVHRKSVTMGLIGPGNGGLPCAIDDLRVLVTDAGRTSLIWWVLGTVLVVSKMLTFLEMRMHLDSSQHFIPHSLRADEIVATVCSCTKLRRFRLSPLLRKPSQRLTWSYIK